MGEEPHRRADQKVRALVTPRVNDETVFLPFHSRAAGWAEDMLDFYPDGAAPIVRGEAVNTATTYGYDVVTMMQESKTTVCQIVKAGEHHGKNEIPVTPSAASSATAA